MNRVALCLALCAPLAVMAQPTATPEPPGSSYDQLAKLFTEWREFNHPAIEKGRPDYSAAAMTKKAKGLADFRARLKSIDPAAWSTMHKMTTASSKPK